MSGFNRKKKTLVVQTRPRHESVLIARTMHSDAHAFMPSNVHERTTGDDSSLSVEQIEGREVNKKKSGPAPPSVIRVFDVSSGAPVELSMEMRLTFFKRAAQAFPGLKAFVHTMSIIAELHHDLLAHRSLDGFSLLEALSAPDAPDLLTAALAKVIADAGFFPKKLADGSVAKASPDRLNRLLVQFQALGLLSTMQVAEALDKAFRTFVLSQGKSVMAQTPWNRETFLLFVRCIDGYDMRALSALGTHLWNSARNFEVTMKQSVQVGLLSKLADADADAKYELCLAAYFAFYAAMDVTNMRALLAYVDELCSTMRFDRIQRFLALTGEFRDMPITMRRLLTVGGPQGEELFAAFRNGLSLIPSEPADPAFASRLSNAVRSAVALDGPRVLVGKHRQLHYQVPAMEEQAKFNHSLSLAQGDTGLWGAEAFYSKENTFFKLAASARNAKTADRLHQYLGTVALLDLLQLDLQLIPVRMTQKFNFSSPTEAEFEAMFAHYRSGPKLATTEWLAGLLPAARPPPPINLYGGSSRAASGSVTPASVRSAADADAEYLTQAQFVRLVADSVLATVRGRAVAAWIEVAMEATKSRDQQIRLGAAAASEAAAGKAAFDAKRLGLDATASERFVAEASDAAELKFKTDALENVETYGTAFVELRSRIESMLRGLVAAVRPTQDVTMFVKKSDLHHVIMPKPSGDPKIDAAVAEVSAAARELPRQEAPPSVLFFAEDSFGRKQVSLSVRELVELVTNMFVVVVDFSHVDLFFVSL